MKDENAIIISPKAKILDGNIEQNEKKYEATFSRAKKLKLNAGRYATAYEGNIFVARDQSLRHARFHPNNLILSELSNDKSIIIQTGIDLKKLRFAITYFDKIVLPKPSCGTDFTYKVKDLDFLKKQDC